MGTVWSRWLFLGAVLLLLAGCSTSHQRSVGVVKYLYGSGEPRLEEHEKVVMEVPVRVGIAFVPEEQNSGEGLRFSGVSGSLSEQARQELMGKIAADFRAEPRVRGIELIPTHYLQAGGGFDDLERLRHLYGIDVIVLLSTDQVQHTDKNIRSLSYLTLIGMFVVSGELNDTSTLLDAAVFHIPSRRMLFQAAGISHVTGSATPVNLTLQLREDSQKGYELAASDLVLKLREQLAAFKVRARNTPEEFQVIERGERKK